MAWAWQGDRKDGKEVLVKHGGHYVKVHTCRLQKSATASPSLEMTTINSELVPAPDTSASGLAKSAKPFCLDDMMMKKSEKKMKMSLKS